MAWTFALLPDFFKKNSFSYKQNSQIDERNYRHQPDHLKHNQRHRLWERACVMPVNCSRIASPGMNNTHTKKKLLADSDANPHSTAPTWVHSANLAVSQPPRGRSRANHSIVINQPVCEIHDGIINYAGGSHGLQCVMCPVSSFRARETLDLLVG